MKKSTQRRLPSAACALFLPLSLLGCAGLSRPESSASPPQTRPNLVVILSDDHRWDALGAAGNPNVITPVIDRLVREGVYFRQAIVPVSQCHPIRSSLMTGLPSFKHGVYSNKALAPGVEATLCQRPTLASLLRDAGYRTVLVGKWHLPASPKACGFTEIRTWSPGGGGVYHDPELVHGDSEEYQPVLGYTQEIFTDDALGFLRSPEAQHRPFLLWLGYTAPHFPYQPNPRRIQDLYIERSDQALLPPNFPRDVQANDWRHYDEAVSLLDEQLGRILDALRQTGLAGRTVVAFLGDNGYMMGERGIGGPDSVADGKAVPYESSLRVPFLLLGPGLPRGLVSDLPVSGGDLPPTLLSLAGLPVPEGWQGRDLQGALSGKVPIEEAFAEWSDDRSEKFAHIAFRAVRTPKHKLILWKDPSKGEELYDLVADPHEEHNLVADPASQEVLRDLRARLAAWMQRNDDPALAWRTR